VAGGQKKARRERRWVIFLDESGFMLQPHRRRTWAVRGRTPTLRVWDRRDRRSVIGCVGLSPGGRAVRLDWQMYPHNVRAPQVEDFVRRQVGRHGRIVLVLDRWNVHRAAVRRLQAGLGRRVHVEWLPAYAPDLDPAEQMWNHAKYADLANFVPDDISHLARRVGLSFHHQSRNSHLLWSFFRTAKLRV
jgi:transposase